MPASQAIFQHADILPNLVEHADNNTRLVLCRLNRSLCRLILSRLYEDCKLTLRQSGRVCYFSDRKAVPLALCGQPLSTDTARIIRRKILASVKRLTIAVDDDEALERQNRLFDVEALPNLDLLTIEGLNEDHNNRAKDGYFAWMRSLKHLRPRAIYFDLYASYLETTCLSLPELLSACHYLPASEALILDIGWKVKESIPHEYLDIRTDKIYVILRCDEFDFFEYDKYIWEIADLLNRTRNIPIYVVGWFETAEILADDVGGEYDDDKDMIQLLRRHNFSIQTSVSPMITTQPSEAFYKILRLTFGWLDGRRSLVLPRRIECVDHVQATLNRVTLVKQEEARRQTWYKPVQ